jgi:hypothetical protein
VAEGDQPLTYQWYLNGDPIWSETRPTLRLNRVSAQQAGTYSVTVKNDDGMVTSATAFVTVVPAHRQPEQQKNIVEPPAAPKIAWPPLPRTAVVGDSPQFQIRAYGAQPLHFQWRFNGRPIASETNATLALRSVSAVQAGAYDIIVSNFAGIVTSQPASLRVVPSWRGQWKLSETMELTLRQDGRDVQGSVSPGDFDIDAHASGNLLEGNLTVYGEAFPFKLTLAPDERSFSGAVTNNGTPEPWAGKRVP